MATKTPFKKLAEAPIDLGLLYDTERSKAFSKKNDHSIKVYKVKTAEMMQVTEVLMPKIGRDRIIFCYDRASANQAVFKTKAKVVIDLIPSRSQFLIKGLTTPALTEYGNGILYFEGQPIEILYIKKGQIHFPHHKVIRALRTIVTAFVTRDLYSDCFHFPILGTSLLLACGFTKTAKKEKKDEKVKILEAGSVAHTTYCPKPFRSLPTTIGAPFFPSLRIRAGFKPTLVLAVRNPHILSTIRELNILVSQYYLTSAVIDERHNINPVFRAGRDILESGLVSSEIRYLAFIQGDFDEIPSTLRRDPVHPIDCTHGWIPESYPTEYWKIVEDPQITAANNGYFEYRPTIGALVEKKIEDLIDPKEGGSTRSELRADAPEFVPFRTPEVENWADSPFYLDDDTEIYGSPEEL